jgi:hypothetical protein
MVLSTHPKDFLLELVIEKIKSTTNHFSKIQYHFYFIFFHVDKLPKICERTWGGRSFLEYWGLKNKSKL